MLSHDLRLDVHGVHLQPACKMETESHGSKIGEWIGGIGDDHQECLRRYRNDFGNNVPVDFRVGIEKFQPSGGIVAVRRATGFFVDARGDDHEYCFGKVGIIACAEFHRRRKCSAILEIGYDTLCTSQILVNHDDLAGNSAHHERQETCGTHAARANDSNLHERPPLMTWWNIVSTLQK